MQDQNTLPAPEAGDDEALWNELEKADAAEAKAPPPTGREADDDAAFTADEPDPSEADQGDDEPSAEGQPDAGAQEAPDDPWAKADPTLKAAFDEKARALQNLEHQIKSDRGRLSAMQKKLDELSRSASPANQPKPGDDREERRRKLAEEYPEVAQPILDEMDALKAEIANLSSAETRREQMTLEQQEAALTQQHADWQQILGQNGATFAAWAEDQPKAIREMVARNANQIADAQAAAEVIGRFKQYLGIGEQPQQQAAPSAQAAPRNTLSDKRQRQLAASAAPSGGSRRPVASGIPEDGDPQAIWDAFEAAERQGR
jgi:hypothetical protein